MRSSHALGRGTVHGDTAVASRGVEMADMQWTPVTPAAAPFLHRLANDPLLMEALGDGPSTLATWEGAIAAWLDDPDEADFLITSVSGGPPFGWIGINGLASTDRVAWIKMLALAPAAWGNGYGSAALGAAKAWLAAERFTRVKLWTDATNIRARRCYERNGFTVEAERLTATGSPRGCRRRLCMACALEPAAWASP